MYSFLQNLQIFTSIRRH